MQENIKFIILLSVMAVFSVSCNSAKNEVEASGLEAEVSGENNQIRLSAEQIKMAGITYGEPQSRKISKYIECTGKVEVPPNSLASVYSSVRGFVGSVKYLPGDYVKKGSLLTTIKHPEIIKLQTQYLECKSRLEFAEKEYQRKQALAAEDATSQKILEEAKVNLETERAVFKGLKAELDLVGLSVQQIENGEILPYIQIYAPINGFVASVNINKGKLIGPEDLLYEIVDDSHMHLELQIFAKDIPKVRKGQYIEASVPGLDAKIGAEVYLVGHVIDMETKTTMVHGHFENKPPTLTAGTYLHARIFESKDSVMAIPQSALIRSGEDFFVYVLKDGIFIRKDVTTGASDDEYVAIEGLLLEEGEQLVTGGAYYIHGSGTGE